MKINKTAIVLSLAAFLLCAVQFFKGDNQKIAYVFVDEVIAEYHAMQDVNDKLQLNESLETEKLDEFYRTIQDKISWLRQNSQKIKDSEALSKQHEIVDMEKAHNRMQQRAFQKLDSLRASWTGPIYEQVNEYIKNYSLENGYDYVLGNLGNGNVMYGNPTHNITLEVIDAINVAYNKRK